MTNKEIELQALIAERDGMVADNQYCIHYNHPPSYVDSHFYDIANRIRALKTPEPEPVPTEPPTVAEILQKWLEDNRYAGLEGWYVTSKDVPIRCHCTIDGKRLLCNCALSETNYCDWRNCRPWKA